MSASSPPDDPLRPVVDEFVARIRRGEHPSLTDYEIRYPDLADRIGELFPTVAEIEMFGVSSDAGRKAEWLGLTSADRLGDFLIVREVGRGGMGIVYEAIQESLGRRVALKVLSAAARMGRSQFERFELEARSAARLHHTNIVPIYGIGQHGDLHYYTMQFIRGRGLDVILDELTGLTGHRDRSGTATNGDRVLESSVPCALAVTEPTDENGSGGKAPASEPEAVARAKLTSAAEPDYYRSVARIGLQVADALAYAHQQGILHRDIKPSNLLLDVDGVVWVTDFGLAKAEGSAGLTETGDLVGTLRYMAPERFDGRSDRRSDVYSLGATLYELATLRPVFGHQDRARLVNRVLRESPIPPRRYDPGIPRDLETILLRAIAKDATERFESATEMADELRRFLDRRPIQSRPISAPERLRRWCRRNPVLAGLSALAAVLVVGIALVSSAAALSLKRQRDDLKRERVKTLAALDRAVSAERSRVAELGRLYEAQAHASRQSRSSGQRFEALDAVAKALRIARASAAPPERIHALRLDAIAALALPDVRETRTFGHCPEFDVAMDIDARFERYARADRYGNVSVRAVDGDAELYRMEGRPDANGAWVMLARDGRSLVVNGHDWLRFWRLVGPKPALVLELSPGDYRDCTFAISPDSRELVYASESVPLARIDIATGRAEALPASEGRVVGLAVHPDCRRLVVVLERDGKTAMEVRTADCARALASVMLPGRFSRPYCNPDGRQVLVAGSHARIRSWDIVSGALRTFEGALNGGIHIAFNHRGTLFATNGWEARLRLWDAVTGRQVFSVLSDNPDIMRFSLDDRTLTGAAVPGHGWQRLEVAGGREYRSLSGASTTPKGAGNWFCPDDAVGFDGRVLAGSRGVYLDGVQLWDIDRGEEAVVLTGPGKGALAIFDTDGSMLTIGARGIHHWPVRRLDRGAWQIGPPAPMVTLDLLSRHLARSRDGRVLAVADFHAGALVVHRDHPDPPIRLGPQQDVRRIAVSPDGRFVATASWNGTNAGVFVWDAGSGQRVQVLPAADRGSVQFSPDGRWLATGAWKGNGRLWRVGTWTAGPEIAGVGDLVFSSDASLLVQGCQTDRIHLLDPSDGHLLAVLQDPYQNRAESITVAPDATRLLTACDETQSIHVWDLRLIRAGLETLELDWDRPSFPASPQHAQPVETLTIQVDLGALAQ